jgi:hypothetical protein
MDVALLVISVSSKENNIDTLLDKLLQSLDSTGFSVVISSGGECGVDSIGRRGEVLISSNSSLKLRGVEIFVVITIWEWIWSEFPHVVFIPSKVDVVYVLNQVGTEVVC